MWFHTSSCPYSPPPSPQKRHFNISRSDVKIYQSQWKKQVMQLLYISVIFKTRERKTIVLLNRLFLVGIIKSIILRIVRRGGTLLRSFALVWKGRHFSNSFYFLLLNRARFLSTLWYTPKQCISNIMYLWQPLDWLVHLLQHKMNESFELECIQLCVSKKRHSFFSFTWAPNWSTSSKASLLSIQFHWRHTQGVQISEFKVSLFCLFSFTINPLSSHNHSYNNQ